MQDAETDDYDVEARVRKGEIAGISFAEGDVWMKRRRFGDHRRGKIQRGDLRAAPRGRGGDIARAGSNVEQDIAGMGSHGIEQRFDTLRSQRAEIIFVQLDDLFPGAMLEFPERFWSGIGGFHNGDMSSTQRTQIPISLNLTTKATNTLALAWSTLLEHEGARRKNERHYYNEHGPQFVMNDWVTSRINLSLPFFVCSSCSKRVLQA